MEKFGLVGKVGNVLGTYLILSVTEDYFQDGTKKQELFVLVLCHVFAHLL